MYIRDRVFEKPLNVGISIKWKKIKQIFFPNTIGVHTHKILWETTFTWELVFNFGITFLLPLLHHQTPWPWALTQKILRSLQDVTLLNVWNESFRYFRPRIFLSEMWQNHKKPIFRKFQSWCQHFVLKSIFFVRIFKIGHAPYWGKQLSLLNWQLCIFLLTWTMAKEITYCLSQKSR